MTYVANQSSTEVSFSPLRAIIEWLFNKHCLIKSVYLKFDKRQNKLQIEQTNKYLLRNIQTQNVFNIQCCLKMENAKEKFNYTRSLLVILLAICEYVVLQITSVQ